MTVFKVYYRIIELLNFNPGNTGRTILKTAKGFCIFEVMTTIHKTPLPTNENFLVNTNLQPPDSKWIV